jgi:hypothetical protein
MNKEAREIPASAFEAAPERRMIDPLASGDVMLAFIRVAQNYNAGLVLLTQEVLDFSRQRMSQNSATALSMAQCKDWSEASKIHREWIRAFTEEYSAEMGKLFRLAARTATDSCRPLQESTLGMWPEPNGRR